MGYIPCLGRIALFWEKSPLSFPWIPDPCSARHQILPLCPLWFMAPKQRKISAKSLSPKADMRWYPCLVAEEQTPPQGHWAGVPASASSPWLFLIMAWGSLSLLCAMSQAQPLCCCLGPSNLLERGHMHQEWARAMLKQEGSDRLPGLCGSRCPRPCSYTPHAASRGKMAASCWAAAGYLHCLVSVISPGHTLCVQVERDQRSRFPVRDVGGTCSHVCLTGFTNRGFANHVCLTMQLRPLLCSCEKSTWGCSWSCLLGTTSLCRPALALQERSPSGHVCSTNPLSWKVEAQAGLAGGAAGASPRFSLW